MISTSEILKFQQKIYDFYTQNKRDFSWREDITPYRIVVSEIMLQQTQTARVKEKFENWMCVFPDFKTLAQAPQSQVLLHWQGLGYNRRGVALHTIAKLVVDNHNGMLPADINTLQTFPSIGPNTAGSIAAFAFNMPTIFIETNIRTVYTCEFFAGKTEISDKDLISYIQATLDTKNPRDWYYALMDYGVSLKKLLPRINSASKHYAKQSTFKGSKRQIRGHIIKILTQFHQLSYEDIVVITKEALPLNLHSIETVIQDLLSEKLIYQKNDIIHL